LNKVMKLNSSKSVESLHVSRHIANTLLAAALLHKSK